MRAFDAFHGRYIRLIGVLLLSPNV